MSETMLLFSSGAVAVKDLSIVSERKREKGKTGNAAIAKVNTLTGFMLWSVSSSFDISTFWVQMNSCLLSKKKKQANG